MSIALKYFKEVLQCLFVTSVFCYVFQCAVGTTGQKSISRVIEYLEHC